MNSSLLTSEQYLALPDEYDSSGERVRDELIGGVHVQYPVHTLAHSLVVSNILRVLHKTDASHSYEILAQTGYQVSDYDTFVPDVSIVSRDKLSLKARIIQGPPAVAIEVVAPFELAVHLKRKIDAYLENGSERVWVVFPDASAVEVYSRGEGRKLYGDQMLEEPLLPGWSTPVSKFFDRLK